MIDVRRKAKLTARFHCTRDQGKRLIGDKPAFVVTPLWPWIGIQQIYAVETCRGETPQHLFGSAGINTYIGKAIGRDLDEQFCDAVHERVATDAADIRKRLSVPREAFPVAKPDLELEFPRRQPKKARNVDRRLADYTNFRKKMRDQRRLVSPQTFAAPSPERLYRLGDRQAK